MQWDSIGQREISGDQLREWFQLEGRYPSIKDFKKWVLEPAVAQNHRTQPSSGGLDTAENRSKVTHLAFCFENKSMVNTNGKTNTKRGKLSDGDIAKQARPGETWESARARLTQLALGLT